MKLSLNCSGVAGPSLDLDLGNEDKTYKKWEAECLISVKTTMRERDGLMS